MDLRKRLAVRLAGFSGALLLVAGAVLIDNLRSDVANEVQASTRLADLLLVASSQGCSIPEQEAVVRIAGIIEQGELRHVSVRLRGGPPTFQRSFDSEELPGWLGHLAGVPELSTAARTVSLGDHALVISPDPRSEIREIVRDTVRVLAALLLFSVAAVVAAWYAAHRALAPVREIVAALARLERGEREARLPPFELMEYTQVAGAIERLAKSLDAGRRRQRRLTCQLMSLQESERRDLARELHDELGQNLAAIAVTAAHVERHAGSAPADELSRCGKEIERDVLRIASHVRSLLARLRPHDLDGVSLIPALQELLDNWEQRAGTIRFDRRLPERLPPIGETAALALYRILQEALTNVARHSQATRCTVELWQSEGVACLRIEDNGIGRKAVVDSRIGGGLLGMWERAQMAGGGLDLEDVHPAGIRICVRLPLANHEEAIDDPHHAG